MTTNVLILHAGSLPPIGEKKPSVNNSEGLIKPYVGLWQPAGNTWRIREISDKKTSDNNLLADILTLLTDNKVRLSDITHIGAMIGPSSYTQLRKCIATANALSWVNRLPLFSFTSEDSLPESLSALVSTAKLNIPLEPRYPTSLG